MVEKENPSNCCAERSNRESINAELSTYISIHFPTSSSAHDICEFSRKTSTLSFFYTDAGQDGFDVSEKTWRDALIDGMRVIRKII